MAARRASFVVASALALTAVAEEPTLPWFLEKGAIDRSADRALRVRDGNLFLTSDGPALAHAADAPAPMLPVELVVIEPGGRPRVVVSTRTLRVAVYIDPASLADAALPGAVVLGAPAGGALTPLTAGVRLAPGTPVTLEKDATGAFPRARYDDATFAVMGYIERARLARIYRLTPPERPRWKPDAVLRGTPPLLAEPSGPTLATPRAAGTPVERLGPSRGGYVLVRIVAGRLDVVAWAAADALVARPGQRVADAAIADTPDYSTAAGARAVRSGTPLYDRPGGQVIGVTTAADEGVAIDEERGDGWWRSDFATPLGEIPLWMEPSR